MPELPEVQTIVNDLKTAGLVGATISGARVCWSRTIAEPSVDEFCSQIIGQKIADISRRGKFIVFSFVSGLTMLIHLRMSGRLNIVDACADCTKHEHIIFNFGTNLHLRFHDTRKFGRIHLLKDPGRILDKLGPEPLDEKFTQEILKKRLLAHKRMLKPLLLDQAFIAGLGNIYVDEALWEARIHPCRTSCSLTDREIRSLHRAICLVLRRGLKNLGTTLGDGETNFYSVARRKGRNRDELRVFRRTGEPCPRCRTLIERMVVGQRSSHICPVCQQLEGR
ncbi:MAG: DNA-formamidopyrimidine glycosylase [Deltaproteobacteria bacterium]|nr:DNA-formamidopyrimidine glycosylase [Deltaproteobacteria bacterium]